MKNKLILLTAFVALVFTTLQNCKKDNKEIFVPAGKNALAKAIADVDEGGTVRLGAGLHTEDKGVFISKRICLVGDPGAVLQVNTHSRTDNQDFMLDVAVHVKDVSKACVKDIEFQPLGSFGGTAVMFENSPESTIEGCKIINHEVAIVVQKCDDLIIKGNKIEGALLSGQFCAGVVWINGKSAQILQNDISNCYFGIWPCDEDGVVDSNTIYTCAYGVIPCKVVRKSNIVNPRTPTDTMEASINAKGWQVINNHFHHNQWGVGLTDGSNHCLLRKNIFNDNGNTALEIHKDRQGYDIELLTDYPENTRFGPPVFACYDNTVEANSTDKVKKCSDNGNVVIGGILVDLNLDPCK